MDLLAELQALSDRFRADDIVHALCGAVALALHGVPRATQDIDLLVARADLDRAPPATGAPSAASCACARGVPANS